MQVETFAQWAGIEPEPSAIDSLKNGWTIYPLLIDGTEVAAACMSGSEIHFAVAPKWRHRVIARHRTRAFLAPLLAIHGFLTTRAKQGDARRRFLERLGFVRTWGDGVNDHFMMTELPFGKHP